MTTDAAKILIAKLEAKRDDFARLAQEHREQGGYIKALPFAARSEAYSELLGWIESDLELVEDEAGCIEGCLGCDAHVRLLETIEAAA